MHLGESMLFYQQQNNFNPASLFKKISNYVFRFDQKIGQGNFSKVYKGQHQLTKQTVAIKIIQLSSIKSPKLQELLFSQIQVIQSLNHPNILKCYEVLRSQHNCYIITELCNGGDLQSLLKKSNYLNEQAAIPYLKNIYQGLLYLSERGIVHRDLKSANIFLHNGIAKIADFGFAKYTNNQTFKDMDIGSPLYMSPEGMIDHIYGMKTDIWSFGIIIYELLHGCNPYGRCQTEYQLKRAVLFPLQNQSFRGDISREVINLIKKCLQINFQTRPSAPALLSDPFICFMMNREQPQVSKQKRLQWADHIIQTHNYLENPQFNLKKYPSSQEKINVENYQDCPSRSINNRSYGMIPKGVDASFSKQFSQISKQRQLKFKQPNQTNFNQSKNSPKKFLNLPQDDHKIRKLSPNNSDSNINYKFNHVQNKTQNNSVNNSFTGMSNQMKSTHITPNRKDYDFNDTSIMVSSQAKKKKQLQGSKNSNDSYASYNPYSSAKTNNFNQPRGSYQQNSAGKNNTVIGQQKNIQLLINQNRLQLQKKQQFKSSTSNINMLNSVPVHSSDNQKKSIEKLQFSSGKKFGQLIKGEKKTSSNLIQEQKGSNKNISNTNNKNLSQNEKIGKSKSHIQNKSSNLSIYTDSSYLQNTSILPSPNKTNSNYFPKKQIKPFVNTNISQRGQKNQNNFVMDQKQKNNVVSTVIEFKQAVGLLHYCRLIFRFVTTLRKIKLILLDNQIKKQLKNQTFLLDSKQQNEEILSRFLITVLDQLLKKIKLKGIIYQGDNYKKKQLKETKLIEVAQEYFRKYVKEINKNRKGKQISAIYDVSTSLDFFKTFSGQILFNLQNLKEDIKKCFFSIKSLEDKIQSLKIQITNICYLGIRLCQSTEVIVRCYLHKNYQQLSKLTIQNWLAHQNYNQKQYQACLKQRQKEKKIQMTLLKGSQTNDTQQNNRFYDVE